MKKYTLTLLILIICFLFSCNKQKTLEEYIINGENEYWAVWVLPDTIDKMFDGKYYQFQKDNTFKTLLMGKNENLGIHPLFNKKNSWSVTKDSFFTHNGLKSKIITINDDAFVLSNEDTLTGEYIHTILVKERIDKSNKSSYFYVYKNKK